jgi:predicted DNA-binding transcriptional regulator AlpA
LTLPLDQAQIKPLGGRRQRISTTFETQPEGDPEMTAVTPMLLRVNQVAEILGIGRTTVWKYAKEGKLPKPIKWQGNTVWRVKDLEEFVEGLSP